MVENRKDIFFFLILIFIEAVLNKNDNIHKNEVQDIRSDEYWQV